MAKDGTGILEDSEKTSAELQGTSQETPTFTESQFRESVKKAVSDALSAAGRDSKRLQEQQKQLQKGLDDLERKRIEIEQTELANLEGDPDGQTLFKLKREYARLQAKSNRDEEELQELRQKYSDNTRKEEARRIATEFDVDPEDLLMFTDGTPEKMEILAKKLPRMTTKPSLKTDSGKTIGSSGGILTTNQVVDIRKQMAKEKDPAKVKKMEQELDEAWRSNRIK